MKFDYNRSPEAIILACHGLSYEPYDLGPLGDVYRNRDLLELYEGVDVLGINMVAPRFAKMKQRDDFSDGFEARRAGEVLRWATDRGIVERLIEAGQPAWRILDREMNYLAIGPATRQRAIRIRGLRDPAKITEASRAASREYKRLERARLKQVARYRTALIRNLDIIAGLSPMEPLPEELEHFRIEGHPYLRNYRDVLIDANEVGDGGKICRAVAFLGMRLLSASRDARHAAHWTAAESPVLPDDDADALGGIDF